MDEKSNRQLAEAMPKDAGTLATYRELVGGAYQSMIGRQLPPSGSIVREKVHKDKIGDYLFFRDLLKYSDRGEELPVISFYPTAKAWNQQVVIWTDGGGKSSLLESDGRPIPEIRGLLDAGMSVVSADLMGQGEFLADGRPLDENRVVENPREFAGYTFGYNHTLLAQRVHDILTLVSFVRNDERAPQKVHLVGIRGAGPWVAAARGVTGVEVDSAAIDGGDFRFANIKSYRDVNFQPGAVKYGDLPGLLALAAPYRLYVSAEVGDAPAIVKSAFAAAGAEDALRWTKQQPDRAAGAIAAWLLEK